MITEARLDRTPAPCLLSLKGSSERAILNTLPDPALNPHEET